MCIPDPVEMGGQTLYFTEEAHSTVWMGDSSIKPWWALDPCTAEVNVSTEAGRGCPGGDRSLVYQHPHDPKWENPRCSFKVEARIKRQQERMEEEWAEGEARDIERIRIEGRAAEKEAAARGKFRRERKAAQDVIVRTELIELAERRAATAERIKQAQAVYAANERKMMDRLKYINDQDAADAERLADGKMGIRSYLEMFDLRQEIKAELWRRFKAGRE